MFTTRAERLDTIGVNIRSSRENGFCDFESKYINSCSTKKIIKKADNSWIRPSTIESKVSRRRRDRCQAYLVVHVLSLLVYKAVRESDLIFYIFTPVILILVHAVGLILFHEVVFHHFHQPRNPSNCISILHGIVAGCYG